MSVPYRITPGEFNATYGHSTYKENSYIMASDEDIGTFVCMKFDGQTLPYFCHWAQETTHEKLPQGEAWGNYHSIVAEVS